MENVNFRKFNIMDKEKVIQLMHNLREEDPEELPLDDDEAILLLESIEKNSNLKLFIIEHDNHLIGYGQTEEFYSLEYGGNSIEIADLFIEKDFRSRGIGTDFIKWIEEDAKHRDIKAVILVATDENKKAQALYERLEFKPLKRIIYYKKI